MEISFWSKQLILLFLVLIIVKSEENKLDTIYEWKLLDYDFPSERDRQNASNNGNFILENNIPIDVAPHYNAAGQLRVFVTIPRFDKGIPITLATVSNSKSNKLQPYPSYSWHNSHGANCETTGVPHRVIICDKKESREGISLSMG